MHVTIAEWDTSWDNVSVSGFCDPIKLMRALVVILVISLGTPAYGGPELEYVEIYKKINSATQRSRQGNTESALALFQSSLDEITAFRAANPKWNPGIIQFRIAFIKQKMEELRGGPAPAEVNNSSSGNGVSTGVSASSPTTADPDVKANLAGDRQILNHLRSRVEALELDKLKLENKLREALTASPDQINPKEIAEARKKVRDLTIENQLLQVQLAESVKKAANIQPSSELDQKVQDLSDQVTILTLERKGLQLEIDRLSSRQTVDGVEIIQTPENNRILDDLKDMVSQLEGNLESTKMDLLAKTRSETEMKKNLEAITSVNDQLTNKNLSLTSQIKDLEDRLGQLDKLDHYQNHIEALESDLASKDEEIEKLSKENQKLQASNESLQNKIKSLTTENFNLTQLLASKEEQILNFDNELKKSVAYYKDELQKKDEENQRLADSVEKTAEEIARMDSTFVKVQKEVNTLRVANNRLKDENELLKKWLADLSSSTLNDSGNELIESPTPVKRLTNYQPPVEPVPNSNAKANVYSLATGEDLDKQLSISEPPPGNTSPSATIAPSPQKAARIAEILKIERELLNQLKEKPNDLELRNRYAALLMDKGDFVKARAYVERTISMFPKESEALVLKALLERQQKNFKEAVAILAKAIELNPKNPNAHMLLGTLLSELGHRKAAEESLRRAVRLDPENPLAHFNLSVAYLYQNPPYKALAQFHYQEAVRLGHHRDAEIELRIQSAQ